MRSTAEVSAAIGRISSEDRAGHSDAALLSHFRDLQAVRHQLDAEIAATTVAIHHRGAAKYDGAGSTKAWLRNHLRFATATAGTLVDTAIELPNLRLFGPALTAGKLSLAHVTVAAKLAQKVGPRLADRAEAKLFPHAKKMNPTELQIIANRIIAHLMPDPDDDNPPNPPEPERSLYISQTLDGVSDVRGCLTPETGAMWETLATSQPRPTPGDKRTLAERNHDLFAALLRRGLDSAEFPTNGGEQPHITVLVHSSELHSQPTQPEPTQCEHTPAGSTRTGHRKAGHTPAGHTHAGRTDAGHTPAGDTQAGFTAGEPTPAEHTYTEPTAANADCAPSPTGPTPEDWTFDCDWTAVANWNWDLVTDWLDEPLEATEVPASATTSGTASGSAEHEIRADNRGPDWIRGTNRLPGPGDGAYLEFGGILPRAAFQRLCCDATYNRVVLNADDIPTSLGYRVRLVSPGQRRLLALRDGGCRFPYCDRPAQWTQAHHVIPWEQGGPTNTDNLVLLCNWHHHCVHDYGWTLDFDGTTVTIHRPDGTLLEPPP